MSLQTFLSRIYAEVKSLFSKLPEELQQAAQIAVTIVEAIKNFDTKNPEVADIITTIIPGEGDDKVIAWLRAKMPIILAELRLVNTVKALTDPAQITASAIDTIQHLDGDIKNSFLHDLGILIAQEIAKSKNHKLEWSDAVYIVEWYYQNQYKSL